MKSKILRASGTLQIGQTDVLTSSLESALNKFLLGDVSVRHISQSSAILQTTSGLLAHISVCIIYDEQKAQIPRMPRYADKKEVPTFRELWQLLKHDCGNRAVVDRRVLRRRDPRGLQRVRELIAVLTENGDKDKLFSLAIDLNTSPGVLKAYLDEGGEAVAV